MSARDTLVSVVAVVCNAEEYIERYILDVAETLASEYRYYEIVLVDDGSTDRTVEQIETLQQRVNNIQLYCLPRTLQENVALVAGLDGAIGDYVVVLDPRSDPASVVPELLELALKEEKDIVYALARDKLYGRGLYHTLSKLFLRFLSRMNEFDLPLAMSSCRLFSRSVLNHILAASNRHRTLPIAQALGGYRWGTLEYDRVWRNIEVKSLVRTEAFAKAADLLISGSMRPLRLVTLVSLAFSGVSLLYAVYVIATRLIMSSVAPGWASLSLQLSLLFFLVFLILAVMSEYLLRVMEATSNRPLYFISRESRSAIMDHADQVNVDAAEHRPDLDSF